MRSSLENAVRAEKPFLSQRAPWHALLLALACAVALPACAGSQPTSGGGESWSANDLFRASEDGHERAVQRGLRAGLDPDARGSGGVTALMIAAVHGHEGVATRLLDAGADPNVRGEVGQTALTLAEAEGQTALARLLRARGAEAYPALSAAPACQEIRTPRRTATPPPAAPAEPPPDTTSADDALFEQKPRLVGSKAELMRGVPYPAPAQRAQIEGTVHLKFVVARSGAVTEVEVLRSPHASLTAGALGALCRAEFTPGTRRGKRVAVAMAFPVRYQLQ